MSEPSTSSKPHWNPKQYQKRAIKLLLSQASGGLFLDPGLGKTSTVLATIKILREKNLIRAALIVAPLRVATITWPEEIEKWDEFKELSYTIVHGAHKAYNLALPRDIYLINPEGLDWLFNSDIGKRRLEHLDLLVIDESTKFKNSQTKRFKTLKSFLPNFKRRWILTGTIIPNGLEDLFGQIYILDLGRALGRFITHYRKEFFYLAGYGLYDWRPKPESWQVVTERISPLALRLSAEEHLEMPELVNVRTTVVLPETVMTGYRNLEEELLDLELGVLAPTQAAVGMKLRQIANGAVYESQEVTGREGWVELHTAKLDALGDLLEEIGPQPVLLLYEFSHDRERIRQSYPEFEFLGSGTSVEAAQDISRRFNSGELLRLAGHPASMGHGLNLQGACAHVIWFSIPWNFEHYDQAFRRVYRQGQRAKTVFVYHIVAKDTKDEEVMSVLLTKGATQKDLNERLSAHRREHYED